MLKTLLITGGTGFLGKRLAVALKDRYRVILAGRNNKQNLDAKAFSGCEVVPMDVARLESVRDVFVALRPSIVIHAAATKFVDLAEKQPFECVDVNIVGSQNVARAALEYGCDALIGISTDKAAPPVRNIYGLSKAVMERLFCSINGTAGLKTLCVRYGNVAWSTGSVLCIWKKMHEETSVIKTTGPEMRRFFFTIDDAVKLVLTGLDNIDSLSGKVLSRHMKAAQMQEILEAWTASRGGRWEIMQGRPGERSDEYLVGDLELPYTEQITFDGIPHYVISFNEKKSTPLAAGLSSANTDRLTRDEILKIIDNPPVEEK